MNKQHSQYKMHVVIRLKAMALLVLLALSLPTVQAYESPIHTFSIDDLLGGFNGSTYGTAGAIQDTGMICGLAGGVACPEGIAPITDKAGIMLYPVDSEFGFQVVDFLGAVPKTRDDDFREGFVGNIVEGGVTTGLKISNAETDTYKVKPPLGTWCQGLGGNAIKCSTEHFSTMEHVLSCHETIPYLFSNPDTGAQSILQFPSAAGSFDCANAELDNEPFILENGSITSLLTDPTPDNQIRANDNTTVLDDIATTADYSITLKDDGKPLYRWGSLIKRPNDIRIYARLALPAAWKEVNATTGQLANDFKVTSATLTVNHWITNNPNDQLRPEDLENEAATGRKPSFKVDAGTGNWTSTKPCYEGDGDLIDTEEGTIDPTFIGVGTVLKNAAFSGSNLVGLNPPQVFSSDLKGGFTNAFYTTTDRDPFEWSYDSDPSPLVQKFVGSLVPNAALGEFISGPRWRLRANKFGQDIPGLEIPKVDCSKPPFTKENKKYETGEPATTVINLLDWDESTGPSPLATSKGWVSVTNNDFVEVSQLVNGIPVTTNGLPMTNDFDLAVYIKGDRKSTALFNAKLEISYEGEVAPAPITASLPAPDPITQAAPSAPDLGELEGIVTLPSIQGNVPVETIKQALSTVDNNNLKLTGVNNSASNNVFSRWAGNFMTVFQSSDNKSPLKINDLKAPTKVRYGEVSSVSITISNSDSENLSGLLEVVGVSDRGSKVGPFVGRIDNLEANSSTTLTFDWTSDDRRAKQLDWTATVSQEGNEKQSQSNAKTQVSRW